MTETVSPNLFQQLLLFLAVLLCGVVGCPVPV